MTTKLKGICKGSFKYISQIFVVKEREMEIGLPTDVKHVAHIGWDGPAGTSPSWMSEYGTGSELTLGSVGGSRDQTWTSQDVTDFERSFARQTSKANLSNFPPTNLPSIPKKPRRKKNKSSSTSSPKSGGSARSSRSSKSRSMLVESEDGSSRRNSVYL